MIPDELQQAIDEVWKQQSKEDLEEIRELVQQQREDRANSLNHWDVRKEDIYDVFDPLLSYEITGYRPITMTQGLDFDPVWFTETRQEFERTGKYCPYLNGSKRFNEFWKEQYIRCKYGMSVNGYSITGDNYFFLNFYQLPIVDERQASGQGLKRGFPKFFESHYRYFHYLQLAREAHKHAALMKARSIGFSEINAATAARLYTVIRNSRTMITCYNDNFLKGTFSKVDGALTFLNSYTQGGMFQPRLVDKELEKKSGYQEKVNGQFEDFGFKSSIIGVNGNKPSNIRGDRVDLLIYDEAGTWPELTTAVIQGQELCEVQGVPRGIMVFGGTGGDFGKALEGLKKIYYHPRAFKVLPYRHNYTQTGEYEETGFFIPYFVQSLRDEFMDHRGVCDIERYKAELQLERDHLLAVPEEYYKKCAERCWFAEEAFSLEGVNKFNKAKISEQLAEIRLHKRGPRPTAGDLEYTYKSAKHSMDNINGFKWTPRTSSNLKILEHPVWTDLYKENMDKLVNDGKVEESEVRVYNEMHDLYVAGIDGIDIGSNQTSSSTKDPSDFCIVILRRAHGLKDPQIVAMYKDRPGNIREAYKIAMRLLKYYNCRANIEATRVGFITWARENNCLQYFMKRPRATLTDIKYGTTKQYGTPATKTVIEQHTDLTADFVEDYCHTIWYEEILDQLVSYNDDNKGKFDIVAALGMVFLADQELSGRQPTNVVKEVDQFQDYGYYIDSYGVKHYGVIPKKQTLQITREQYDDPYRIESSDPRVYEALLQNGISWRY